MCDDGLYYILKGLTKCPKIKHLSLIKNRINYKGCENLKYYLESWKSNSLVQLYLDSNNLNIGNGLELISQGLIKNKGLKIISLENVDFTPETLAVFFKNIKLNQVLNSIFLSENKVSYQSLKMINEICLSTNICTIKLENNLLSIKQEEMLKITKESKIQYYYSQKEMLKITKESEIPFRFVGGQK